MNYAKRAFIALLIATLLVNPVFAADNPHYYPENGIIFRVDGVTCDSSSQIRPTSTKITESTLKRINDLKGTYEQASTQTGVPWQIFAALDYRENNNSPDKSMLGGEPLGVPAVDSGRVPKTKLESILMGSEILKGLAKDVYNVDVTKDMDFTKLQQAFIVYNRGYSYKRANQSPDTSPYVMNQYDDDHKNMTFPNIPGETLAGRTETSRYGAMTVYANLVNSTDSDSGGCLSGGVGDKVDYTGIYPDLDAGTLPDSLLCTPRPSQRGFQLLKGPACESFIAMDAAYKTAFGKQMPVGQGYRRAAEQIACGGTVTNPGGHNGACAPYNPKNDPPEHLWGTAIDFASPLNNANSREHDWLVKNGPNYGWFWPNWAREGRGGTSGVFEPWHFAYYFRGHNPNSDKLESYK